MKQYLRAISIKGALLAAALLLAASAAHATVISSNYWASTNLDFDASTRAYFPLGFDNATYDIPGWQDYGTPTDCGIEYEGAWWSPYQQYSAFLAAGNGAYILSTYPIASGDVFTIRSFMKGWWDGNTPHMEVTLFYGSDPDANVIGTWTTPSGDTTWTEYSSDPIAAPGGAVGQTLGVRVVNTSTFFVNFDELIVSLDPLVVTGTSPTGVVNDPNQTITATIDEINGGTYVSSTLSVNGVQQDSDTGGSAPVTLSYTATLPIGFYTNEVVAVSSTGTNTYAWTFEVSQPPFDNISITGPTGWSTNDSPVLQAIVVESFSTVSNTTTLYLDDAPVSATIDRTQAPTTTVSYATSGLASGKHTGRLIVVGDPSGVFTNDWTFSVVTDPNLPITLLHHWDFEEGSGSTVIDRVGSADGMIVNTNFAWVDGGLDLYGGGTSGQYDTGLVTGTNVVGSYVDLPNNLVSALPHAITFEAAYMVDDATWWTRVWDMGTDQNHAENVVGTGGEDIFLAPHSNSGAGGLRVSVATNSPGYSHEYIQLEDTVPVADHVGVLTHVVWVYDTDNLITKLYVNGVLIDAEGIASGTEWHLENFADRDLNVWLGRSQYGGDALFNGKLYDFRIYSGVMTAAEAYAHYESAISSGAPTVSPVIQSIAVSGGQVTLSWTAEDKGTYSVLRKTDLTSTTWTPVLTGLPAGNLTTNVDASGSDQEFYQVEGQ